MFHGRARIAAVAMAGMVMAAGMVAGAGPASADQVWHQSVGRASADATCPEGSTEDSTAGWSAWVGSWAEWMNGGTGGFTCDRAVTWAYDAPADAPAATDIGCLNVEGTSSIYFGSDPYLPFGSPGWSNPTCDGTASLLTGVGAVYAPGGITQAAALCEQFMGPGVYTPSPAGSDVWACQTT